MLPILVCLAGAKGRGRKGKSSSPLSLSPYGLAPSIPSKEWTNVPPQPGGGGVAPLLVWKREWPFCPFWSEFGYGFWGNCSSVWRVWMIQLNKKETRKNIRIRNGFEETFFVALSNDDIIIGMDFRGQVLKWMWKMNFFGLKEKKNRAAHPLQELPRVLQFQNWKTLFSLSSSSASYAVYQAV